MMEVSTKVFSLSAGVYSYRFARRSAARYWWIAVLPILLFCVLGKIYGSAWYFLIPVFIFLVYPMLIFWGYYLSVLNMEAALAVRPHSFKFDDGGIRYQEYRLKDDRPLTGSYKGVRIYCDADVETGASGRVFHIPASEILSKEIEGGFLVVALQGRKNRILIVPLEAMTAQEIEKVLKS